ncbi:MAG TPA: FAD-dependent oxidoreductase [Candidatus Dormibacteraeota bacterium]
MSEPRIVIIGAGPTGLGAGYRLNELGHRNWTMLEANDYVGGLATSFTDEAGFTYDIGGHVMFSHYAYYDRIVQKVMGDRYTELNREAWVWMENRFIPYPFQNNIKGLEKETVVECIMGLIEAQKREHHPRNFKEWIEASFGAGIAKHFMIPYNFKVWATPAEQMNYGWIGERVSVVDVEKVLRNVLLDRVDAGWGPNNTFKYPLKGGTGALWNGMRSFVEDHLRLNARVVAVDPVEREVRTSEGEVLPYDVLINTMPLNRLVQSLEGTVPSTVRDATAQLQWNSSHIVGVGIDRPANTTKNWIYFPEPDVPFYRVTYLSNYSPYITPKKGQTLLLTETSSSCHKPENASTIVPRVIAGLIKTGLMQESDRPLVVTTWHCSPSMEYPIPSLGRDQALGVIQPWLRQQRIWSRGRFGAWLYEVGNMDHSTMQGV